MNRETIQKLYDEYCKTSSSINEHLPKLYDLATMCHNVVEIGVKWGRSSTALMLGCLGKLTSYDIQAHPKARALQKLAGSKWDYIVADSRKVEIPQCDLLFIDSDHTYRTLAVELELHGSKPLKWLAFHDTITFGVQAADGESGEYKKNWERGKFNPETHGIRLAIDDFMAAHPHWIIKYHCPNNNGLLILERSS